MNQTNVIVENIYQNGKLISQDILNFPIPLTSSDEPREIARLCNTAKELADDTGKILQVVKLDISRAN